MRMMIKKYRNYALICTGLVVASVSAQVHSGPASLSQADVLSVVQAQLKDSINEEALKNPDAFYKEIATLDRSFQLQTLLDQAFSSAEMFVPAIKAKSELEKNLIKTMLLETLRAQIQLRGLQGQRSPKYYDWNFVAAFQNWDSGFIKPKKSQSQRIEEKGVAATYERYRPLPDAKESFKLREELLKKAENSVFLTVWAIYDDFTGNRFTDLLIETHQRLLKAGKLGVRVMVDGQTAQRPGYSQNIEKLSKAGVPTFPWKAGPLEVSFFGQHQKYFVVDSKTVLAGGRNFGVVYSHEGPDMDEAKQWTDFDFLFEGGTIGSALAEKFREDWNQKVSSDFQIQREAISVSNKEVKTGPKSLKSVQVFFHDPRNSPYDAILEQHLHAIRNAKSTIMIENAYVILNASMERALVEAIQKNRALKIILHTNSPESVDEPIVSYPIFESAQKLAKEFGAQVFLKRGSTLHAKRMVVDDRIVLMGSYNLHPRSLRFENEIIFKLDDPTIGKEIASLIKQNLQTSMTISSFQGSESPLKIDFLKWIREFFYDAL